MDLSWLAWAIPLTLFVVALTFVYAVACWGGRQQASGAFELEDETDD